MIKIDCPKCGSRMDYDEFYCTGKCGNCKYLVVAFEGIKETIKIIDSINYRWVMEFNRVHDKRVTYNDRKLYK